MSTPADRLLSLQAMLSGSNEFGITNSLMTALEDCIEAPRRISEILARLYHDAKTAPSDIDRNYIEWKIEVLEKRVNLGAKEARRRYALIKTLNTQDRVIDELEKCRADSLHWFKNWAWTVDQRENLMPTMPFILFDFQEETINWWEDLVFIKSSDGYLDKSRDQGVSWLVTCWSVKQFLFANRFDALFGSRTEDLVDANGRLDSLFEKMRFQLRMLPEWMLPEGFDWTRDSNFKRIVNPESGSTLAGEAPTTNFARSGRYLFAVLDELAFWPHAGYQAWGAVSQSSRSKLVITTPAGMNNQAADLKFKSDISSKSIHWKRHPWKDQRWYDFQAKSMSREMRAQELDLDYEAAQAGRIFPMWDEVRSVITRSEFMRYFGNDARDELGRFKIPDNWMRGMAMDWGCFPLNTEVLTKDGWKRHDEVQLGELIAAYEWDNKRQIVWSPLLKKNYPPPQSLVEMKSKSFRFLCTPDHYWIVKRNKRGSMLRDTYQRQQFSDIPKSKKRGGVNLVVAAPCLEAAQNSCSPEIAAVLGWVLTDGWIGPHNATICQKKYIQEVIATLNASGLDWRETKPTSSGTRIFAVPAKSWRKVCADTGFTTREELPALVTRLSYEARASMMEAMLLADGTQPGKRSGRAKTIFCQRKGPVADAFQIMATLNGIRLGLQREHDGVLNLRYGVEVSHRTPMLLNTVLSMNKLQITNIDGDYPVWCPSVKEQSVVVRQEGQVCITGNSTEEHRCVSLWVARPSEGFPLRDCVFFYREYMPEVGATPRQVAKDIRIREAPWREYDKVNAMRLMSHEAKSERDTFIKEHALPFEPWETDYNAGVSQLQNYMEVRWSKQHCFHLGMDGMPRMFLIVDDEQGEIMTRLQADGSTTYYILEGTDDNGFYRLRAEIPQYHYPVTEQGKEVGKRRPFKLFDDAVDPARALAAQFFPQVAQEDDKVKRERAMQPELQLENIVKAANNGLTNDQVSNLILSREIYLNSKDRDNPIPAQQGWREKYWGDVKERF